MKPDVILLCGSIGLATLAGATPARAADPTTADCLSASESSLSLRSQHQLRAARAQLLVCAAASCPADVRKECTSRVADVNLAMPTIVFEAKDATGNDMVAVKVTMDGQPLAMRLEGAPLSIDPGEHVFRFELDGQPGVQKTFVIRESEKDRRELIVLGAAAVSTPLEATPATGEAPGGGMSTKRLTGIIVGGAGLLGLGVGTTLLVLASSLSSRSASEDAASPGSGHSDHEAALGDQTAGFVVGGIGIAALGVGAYLVLTGGSSSSRTTTATTALRVLPAFGPHQAGFDLGGAF
jgi:hypothetical protein